MYRHRGNTVGPKQRRKQTSDMELARDIADSIKLHREHGQHRSVEQYARRPEIRDLVEQILAEG